ncbi:hypothetical protein HCU01_13420 [Halomonas cupida]|uniref:Uncharacterized protein n=1 Tax=Halomonas cupida TaxID=44933 RepID=A0ABQ0WFP5_9GAMM|nr:hypothetical protein HCU01_13420 [Halomonas cupida]
MSQIAVTKTHMTTSLKGWCQKAGGEGQQRRLADSRGTHDADDLAWGDLGVESDDWSGAEMKLDLIEMQGLLARAVVGKSIVPGHGDLIGIFQCCNARR